MWLKLRAFVALLVLVDSTNGNLCAIFLGMSMSLIYMGLFSYRGLFYGSMSEKKMPTST